VGAILLSYLLDTNIVSQAAKAAPDARVDRWLDAQNADQLFLSVVTIAELRVGLELMPSGKKKNAVAAWLANTVIPHFHGRILPVTFEISQQCGIILAVAKRAGFTVDPFDSLIAATAQIHHLSVATLNRSHFLQLGAKLVDF
jgi:predicted nucleic acid-binding protein